MVKASRMADEVKQAKLKLAKEAFKRLQKRAKQLQVNGRDLKKIKSLSTLKTHNYKWLITVIICVVLLPSLAFTGFERLDWETQKKLTNYFAEYVLDIDLEKESCLIPATEVYLDLFRPPVDCSVCQDVHTVDVVTNLTKEDFLNKYAYTGRPVLIQNSSNGWSALSHFSFEFFKNIYPKDSPALQSVDKDCQFFPYRSNFESLGQVFNMSDSMAKMQGDPWYIGW